MYVGGDSSQKKSLITLNSSMHYIWGNNFMGRTQQIMDGLQELYYTFYSVLDIKVTVVFEHLWLDMGKSATLSRVK